MADEKKKEAEEKPAATSAVERVREAAKWLIGAFAAIAALLLAGTQVSSIGELSWDDDSCRLIVAGVGLALGLGATLFAILQNVRMLLPRAATLSMLEEDDLKKYFEEHPELLPGRGDTVAQFVKRYRDALSAYDNAVVAEKESSSEATKKALKEAKEWLLRVEGDVRKVLEIANWKATENLFNDDVRWKMSGAAAVAAIGIGLFAWAANPPEDESPKKAVISPAPVLAQLSVKADEKATLRQTLGARCLLNRVLVLEVGGKKEEPEVVTIPRLGCKSARLLVSDDIGIVTAVP